MIRAIMFLGTGSDVGKSIVAAAFCRIFKRRGYKVAPFKAQNMSNNSFVTVEGGEIGRAQVVQAEAAGLLPSVHMNPILLKPSSEMGSQLIVQGRVLDQVDAKDYHRLKPMLKHAVMDSYNRLAGEYDMIVMEGAGSCCEMNLKENDLVNFPMAREAGAACILVGDIDRGGIFPQIVGSFHLMSPEERDMTIGFMVNKFRGDPGLFMSGMDYLEEKTGWPGLGLIPFYTRITIDPEDSVILQQDRRRIKAVGPETLNIAVLKLPAISNFTDMDGLERERDLVLNYLVNPRELTDLYDWVILPGTKNVMEDALWLSRSGWKTRIRRFARQGGVILGLCGGFQLMGKVIRDPGGVESHRKEVKGLGLLPVETVLEREKVVRRVTGACLINRRRVRGYEIHMGRTYPAAPAEEGSGPLLRIHEPGKRRIWEDGWSLDHGRIAGTYMHGVLDSPGLRSDILNGLRRAKGLKERPPGRGRRGRFHQYDRLADHFERHSKVEEIVALI